jgi:hypothetical protein
MTTVIKIAKGQTKLPSGQVPDGCLTFAKAYVGRKRMAQPDERFYFIDQEFVCYAIEPQTRNGTDNSFLVPEGRLKVTQE